MGSLARLPRPVLHAATGVACGIVVTFVTPGTASADGACFNYLESLRWSVADASLGYVEETALVGDRLYALSTYPTVLHVLDVGDPDAPVELGSLGLAGEGEADYRLHVDGSLVYVPRPTGLWIVDVSDPTDPTLRGQVTTGAPAYDVTVVASHAYVSYGHSATSLGLGVVDVSDPDAPTLVTELERPAWSPVLAVSGYVVVAKDEGLDVLDVSDPSAPTPAETWALGGPAVDLDVRNGRLYAVANTELTVLDVTTPTTLSFVASFDVELPVSRLAVDDTSAYVIVDHGMVYASRLVIVGLLGGPHAVGAIAAPDYANGVTVGSERAYVGGQDAGLLVADLRYPGTAPKVGHLATAFPVADVVVAHPYAYVAGGFGGGLGVIDISTPTAPTAVGNLTTLGTAIRVAVSGPIAALSDDQTLRIVDVSAPASPTEMGSVALPSTARGSEFDGGIVFVAADDAGLQVVDASTPEAPSICASIASPDGAYDVALHGNYVYLATEARTLMVVDVTDPCMPALVTSVPTPGYAYVVHVLGDRAYVGDSTGLTIFDLTDPAAPKLESSLATGAVWGIQVRGWYAYLIGPTGMRVAYVADEMSPALMGGVTSNAFARGVGVTDTHVFVADQGDGLAVYEIECEGVVPILEPADHPSLTPARTWLGTAAPNPFNPITRIAFAVRDRDPLSLAIYDTAGRLVRRLADGRSLAPGTYDARWDGRDDAGRAAPSGTYVVRLWTRRGIDEHRKISLIR